MLTSNVLLPLYTGKVSLELFKCRALLRFLVAKAVLLPKAQALTAHLLAIFSAFPRADKFASH